MAVPYSIGKKIELGEEDSKFVVSLLTDQSNKLYQKVNGKYVKVLPSGQSEENGENDRKA